MKTPHAPSHHGLGPLDLLLLAPVCALAAALSWLVATQPPLWWVDVVFDEAYYYLGIARNVVEHGQSSFLPPFQTNGYQPLWLLLLSAAAWVFGTGERALPIEAIALATVFVLLFALASKRWHGRMWPALLVSAGFPAVTTWGLETVMLPVFVLAYFRSQAALPRGLLGSAIVLTRLDALALVVVRDACDLLAGRNALATLRHWLVLGPVLAAYAWINWTLFGTPLPVSGLAKAVGNLHGENLMPLVLYLRAAASTLPLTLLLLAIAWRRRRNAAPLRHGFELNVLLLTLAVCTAYYTLMSGWLVWDSYMWPVMLLAYFALLEGAGLLQVAAMRGGPAASRRDALPLPVLCLVGALGAVLLLNLARTAAGTASRFARLGAEVARQEVKLWSFGRKNVQLVDAFRQARLPQGSFFAMGDRAGSLGYFLGGMGHGHRFIHTEGLVGPKDYLRALAADEGRQFVDALPVDYLIADREKYLDGGDVIGVAEPVQGWSAHVGPYLLCFDKPGIVMQQTYLDQTRLVIDWRQRVACPAAMQQSFLDLRSRYGALRRAALPAEYPGSWMRHLVHDPPRRP